MERPTFDIYANRNSNLRWLYGQTYPIRVSNAFEGIDPVLLEAAEPDVEFHCQELDLNDPDDLKKYTTICQRSIDGWYDVSYIERQRDEKTGKRSVWMEWTQTYMEIRDVNR